MAAPNNINIFYFYLMSLFCSFSITATGSWIAHIPLQWWPLLIPVLFVLVIISASGSGFLHLNSGAEYMLAENEHTDPGLDPNHNVPQDTPPLEHHIADNSINGNAGYEDDRGAVATMTRTDEIQIEEIEIEEICEHNTKQENHVEENVNRSECIEEERMKNRITLEMLLLAQAKFERKQEAYLHRKRKIKRVRALVPSFIRCFSLR